jgi:hypothetical protein
MHQGVVVQTKRKKCVFSKKGERGNTGLSILGICSMPVAPKALLYPEKDDRTGKICCLGFPRLGCNRRMGMGFAGKDSDPASPVPKC